MKSISLLLAIIIMSNIYATVPGATTPVLIKPPVANSLLIVNKSSTLYLRIDYIINSKSTSASASSYHYYVAPGGQQSMSFKSTDTVNRLWLHWIVDATGSIAQKNTPGMVWTTNATGSLDASPTGLLDMNNASITAVLNTLPPTIVGYADGTATSYTSTSTSSSGTSVPPRYYATFQDILTAGNESAGIQPGVVMVNFNTDGSLIVA